MKILIIGGTRFVGRHIVEAALARGHDLTLFNRGRSGVELFAQVEQRRGDRRHDLSALDAGQWDAVIDCCAYLPVEVELLAAKLAGRIGRYALISSVSAYASLAVPNDEDSPLGLGLLEDPATEIIDGKTYGPLKAACEAALLRREPGASIIRPGLVVGPHDHTDRFTYWPARIARAVDGEAVLAPGRPDDAIQYIDVRDLAGFVLDAVEHERSGPFNVVTPRGGYRRLDLLEACAAAAGVRPRWVWADDAWLVGHGVKPWNELPLWLPRGSEFARIMETANGRAAAAGLRLRPLAETAADTLGWWRADAARGQVLSEACMTPRREAALLAELTSGGASR